MSEYIEAPSPREVEVLLLLGKGLATAEIAKKLKITARTVENHFRSLYLKCEVNSKTRLLLWGLRHGYIPFPALIESA